MVAEKMWVALHLQKLLTFVQQNTFEMDIVVTKTVYIMTTNELIKLTLLWITEPRRLRRNNKQLNTS